MSWKLFKGALGSFFLSTLPWCFVFGCYIHTLRTLHSRSKSKLWKLSESILIFCSTAFYLKQLLFWWFWPSSRGSFFFPMQAPSKASKTKLGGKKFEDAYSTYVYQGKFSLLRYTDNAETVIGRLEDEMTPEHAKHDKQAKTKQKWNFRTSFILWQVLIRKLKRQSKISACGFFTVDRSLATIVGKC